MRWNERGGGKQKRAGRRMEEERGQEAESPADRRLLSVEASATSFACVLLEPIVASAGWASKSCVQGGDEGEGRVKGERKIDLGELCENCSTDLMIR